MATSDDLAAELAREIRAAVAEAAPGEPAPASERAPDDLLEVRSPLERAQRYLTPTVPPASRLSGAKSTALRLLRFLWRDQTSFNALMLEATNAIADAIDRQSESAGREARRVEELSAEIIRAQEAAAKEARRRDSSQDTRIAHLETLWSRNASSSAVPGAGNPPAAPLPESVYALFEERFRGPAEQVARKQSFYLPLLRKAPGPVFDAGCGRGELLRLLKESGIPGRGVEASSLAAEACRAAGLDVETGDAIEALTAAPAGSLGAVVAFQVVEHWPAAATLRFLSEARRALAPGGILIVETVNTDSLAAMNAFYLDPTHVRPVPPEALKFLCDAAGFRELEVEYLSPLPADERLEERTSNDVKLNAMLFGPQDYAVIGRVPGA
jgi:SAM-dependent methyltransferase